MGEVSCPEDSGDTWEYWSEWREEWVEDWSLEATCTGNDPTDGPVSTVTAKLGVENITILQLIA